MLIDFLKKYSKIDNRFIDDFFGLYDFKDKYNMIIDLDNVVKWLGASKGHLKATLLKSYRLNIDYKIIKRANDGKQGGSNKEQILLSPKCFKLLAMQSRTKKAADVRLYYYELEQLMDKYKNYIIQGLADKIKELENNQKPRVNRKKGIIYIIQTSDDISLYKLGKTIDLKKRLLNYNADKANNIVPLYIFESDDIDSVESCVKLYAKKAQYRKRKEIYQIDISVLKEIISDCDEFGEKMKLKDISKKLGRTTVKKNMFIAFL